MNDRLASILDRRSCWSALPEQTDELEDGGQIDVLIKERGWPHVIMECKIGKKPEDVDKRFDNTFKDKTKPGIVFEVKYPEWLRRAGAGKLEDATLWYCVWYDKHTRFPKDGWLEGTAYDLATAVQYSREFKGYAEGATKLHDAVMEAASAMNVLSKKIQKSISHIMEQERSIQTHATAALVVAGALRFHDTAAESHDVELIGSMLDSEGYINTAKLVPAWKEILKHDYYPIFSSALQIISELPQDTASNIVRLLHRANGDLARIHLSNSSDLYGQTYQQIISDRKKLAAFYTRPPSAALLAAVSVPDKWRDSESLRNVRVADFACGTGTLLHTVYRQLAANYEIASGQPMASMHSHMMANCLIGADVLPIATHLTAAVLSNTYPRQPYEQTRIFQPRQGTTDHKIGSLEWITESAKLDESETHLTGVGEQGTSTPPAHGSCHVVIMNPPYSRSQGPGGRTGSGSDVGGGGGRPGSVVHGVWRHRQRPKKDGGTRDRAVQAADKDRNQKDILRGQARRPGHVLHGLGARQAREGREPGPRPADDCRNRRKLEKVPQHH